MNGTPETNRQGPRIGLRDLRDYNRYEREFANSLKMKWPLSQNRERGWEPSTRRSIAYQWIQIGVPTGAQLYIHSAAGVGRLTQPWLIGLPKLWCQ